MFLAFSSCCICFTSATEFLFYQSEIMFQLDFFVVVFLYSFIQCTQFWFAVPVIMTKWVLNPACKLQWQPGSFAFSYWRHSPCCHSKKILLYETLNAWKLILNFCPWLSPRAAKRFYLPEHQWTLTVRAAEHPATLNDFTLPRPEVKQCHNL